MANFKIFGIDKAKKNTLKVVREIVYDKGLYNEAHLLLKEEIQNESRNPKTGKRYKKLADSTKKHRRYLARHNNPSSKYSNAEPNLTLTGQLLDGLFSEFDPNTGEITIDITGTHDGYQGKSGQVQGPMPKEAIAEYLAEQGRPILRVSKTLINRIIERIEKALRRL